MFASLESWARGMGANGKYTLSTELSSLFHQAGCGDHKADPRGMSRGPEHHMPAVRGAIPGGCRPRKVGAGGARCASISPALGSPASSDRQEMTDRRSGGNGNDWTMSLAHWILSRTCTAVPCCQPTVVFVLGHSIAQSLHTV